MAERSRSDVIQRAALGTLAILGALKLAEMGVAALRRAREQPQPAPLPPADGAAPPTGAPPSSSGAAPAAEPAASDAAPSTASSETATLEACRAALVAERTGRIRAELALREASSRALFASAGGYAALPIGVVAAPFPKRMGAPRQGALAPDVRAALVLSSAIPPESVEGLGAYSHAWVFFLFHENSDGHKLASAASSAAAPTKAGAKRRGGGGKRRGGGGGGGGGGVEGAAAAGSEGGGDAADAPDAGVLEDADAALRKRPFAALIEAPALRGGRTGVFATRSPHRPNIIGITLVRVLDVVPSASAAAWHGLAGAAGGTLDAAAAASGEGPRRVVLVSGCDLLAGTPILDIKPWAPYDCAACGAALLRGLGRAGGVEDEVGDGEESGGAAEGSTAWLGAMAAAAPEAAAPHGAGCSLDAALSLRAARGDLPPASPAADAVRGPSWVYASLYDTARSRLPVVWGEGTAEAVAAAVRAGQCRFYGSRASWARVRGGRSAGAAAAAAAAEGDDDEVAAALRALSQVLALDIRAVRHGRGSGASAPARAVRGARWTGKEGSGSAAGAGSSAPPPNEGGAAGAAAPAAASEPAEPPAAVAGETVSQRFRFFYDRLLVVFTFREVAAAASDAGADAAASNRAGTASAAPQRLTYVRVERISVGDAPRVGPPVVSDDEGGAAQSEPPAAAH
jgi:tRNA (Thr-GGU) A37 N-methylase